MKIYVVTGGSYSDYHIEAVFTTKELAEAFVNGHDKEKNAYGNDSDIEIEEWDADVSPKGFFQKVWQVWLDIKTGNMSNVPTFEFEVKPRDYSDAHLNGADGIYAESVVSADHAIKIAAEERQRLLREGTGK